MKRRTLEKAWIRVLCKAYDKKIIKPAQSLTTAQRLGSLVKSARDIMRKDRGLNGDLDRLPMLTWVMFLKFLDDMEQIEEIESKLGGKKYRAGHRTPVSLARLGGEEGWHHRRRTHQVHQPRRSRAAGRHARDQGCSPTFGRSKAATAMGGGT